LSTKEGIVRLVRSKAESRNYYRKGTKGRSDLGVNGTGK
jgi:hypothetical protein